MTELIKMLRGTWRLLQLLLHIPVGVGLTVLMAGILRRTARDHSYQQVIRWWLGRVLRILGGRLQVTGQPATQGTLMVSNHISWLDIPVLGGISPVRFLSKQDVQGWPVIGWLATAAGTLYIERGQKGAAQAAADTITASLDGADVVVVFPEGTTSDGSGVLPFHARLFASAQQVQAPVQPVAIRYNTLHATRSDKAPYINDVSLWDNLLGLLGEPGLLVEVDYLPPLSWEQSSRKELAKQSEQQIAALLTQPAPTSVQ